MFITTLLFLLGILMINVTPIMLPYWMFACLAGLLFVIFFFFKNKWFFYLGFFMCGVFWGLVFCAHNLAYQLPKNIENKPAVIEGRIISVPNKTAYGESFLLSLDQLNDQVFNGKVKLSNYHRGISIRQGQCYTLLVKLKRPHGMMNPGGFDYERYLFAHRIVATGYLIKVIRSIELKHSFVSRRIEKLRADIHQFVLDKFSDDFLSSFLSALLVGIRDDVTESQWQVLQKTGTNHLIAIAGLHIGLVVTILFAVFLFCCRFVSRLFLFISIDKVAMIFAALVAFYYASLAGFPIQTVRALLMLCVMFMFKIMRRPVFSWDVYFLALFLGLLMNPLSVLLASFWMSYLSVAVIFMGMQGFRSGRSLWWRFGRIQVVLMAGLMPISFWLYGHASLLGFIANMIAVPWFGFVVMPGIILMLCLIPIFPYAAEYVGHFLLLNLHLLWHFLVFLSQQSWASWQPANLSLSAILFLSIAIMLLFMPLALRFKRYALFLIWPLFFSPTSGVKPKEFNFYLLDVGQGLSSVVITANHVLIFDTGAKFLSGFNMGDAVILPFLRYFSIQTVNQLMISHGDNDHIGGSFALLNAGVIQKIMTSVPERFKHYKVYKHYCTRGDEWQWDGVQFKVLWPPRGRYDQDNNSSCVLKVYDANHSLLLTGDIERPVERELVRDNKADLSATVLVAPHHGSKSSSSLPFIKAVNPRIVLYATGYLNRFHFPNQVVVDRYKKVDIQQFNTANSGAIQIHFKNNAGDLSMTQYRKTHPHIWSC